MNSNQNENNLVFFSCIEFTETINFILTISPTPVGGKTPLHNFITAAYICTLSAKCVK